MKQDIYVKSVLNRLECTKKKKQEIRMDLNADIAAAMEQGEGWEQIEKRMGKPGETAAELNENFSAEEKKKAKRAGRLKIVGVVAAVLVVLIAAVAVVLPKTHPLGTSGRFQTEQIKQNTETVITLFEAGDYETLLSDYCAASIQTSLTEEKLDQAKSMISDHWGARTGLGNDYSVEVSQLGRYYVVTQIMADYENISVTYTLTFDTDGKLSGFFIK